MTIYQNDCIQGQYRTGTLRPYEKCMAHTAAALSDAELLAVILRTGTTGMNATELAEKILTMCDAQSGNLTGLSNISVQQLLDIKGVGKVKAVQIQCICELSRRIAKQSAGAKLDFSAPETIAAYYMQDLRCLDKEHLILVLLDSKCRLLRDMVLSVGTVNASLVNPREVFVEALKYGAVSIVLLHNHPSGDATPSQNDIMVTRRVMKAGELLGIQLLDHIIIGDNSYTSLKEKEYM